MYQALIWLLFIELIGIIVLPIVFRLFRRLPDRGVTLAKPLGLLLATYILWIGGLTPILSNSRGSIVVILLLLVVISAFLLRRWGSELARFLYKERYPLLAGEIVFLALYAMWVAVVSQVPAINHTEKLMNFAFLNAILQSTHFSPEDPWLSGNPISYYYFGHMMMAMLTKLSAIPSNISFNLANGLIPALAGAGAFGVVYNLVRLSGARTGSAVIYALAAPLLLVLVGNLEGGLELVHARGWGSEGFWQWVSISGLEGPGATAGWFPSDHLWWFRGSRIIDTVVDGRSLDFTITEFPFFSFLLGDMHAHVMVLPFLVLTIALMLNMFMTGGRLGLGWLLRHPVEVLMMALALGALGFINLADMPVFAALLVTVVFVKSYRDKEGSIAGAAGSTFAMAGPIVVIAVIMFLPFYLDFNTQVSGVVPLREVSTRPLFFLLIWGLFLVLSLSFLVAQWRRSRMTPSRTSLALVVAITFLPFVIWELDLLLGIFEEGAGDVFVRLGARLGKLLPLLAIIGAVGYALLGRARGRGSRPIMFPLILMGLAFYVLMGVELFRFVDAFGNRMNTVFKAYNQAWLLLSIVSAYGLYYWHSRSIGRKKVGQVRGYAWTGLIVVLVVVSLYYPLGAALHRSSTSSIGATLDGLAFLKGTASEEYEAIQWLRDKASHGKIVEAVGDDYSDYGRISASTGLPTVLGWRFHEYQWRGSTSPYDGREHDILQIYTSADAEQVERLLEKYYIRYVYVGSREIATYGEVSLDRFSSLLMPAFEKGSVVIYERVPQGKQTPYGKEQGNR